MRTNLNITEYLNNENQSLKLIAIAIATASSFSASAIDYSKVNYAAMESLRSALNNSVNGHASTDAARTALANMNADSLEQARISIQDPAPRDLLNRLIAVAAAQKNQRSAGIHSLDQQLRHYKSLAQSTSISINIKLLWSMRRWPPRIVLTARPQRKPS